MAGAIRALNRVAYVLVLGYAVYVLAPAAHSAAPAAAALETATITLSPQDTFLALDNTNYSNSPDLRYGDIGARCARTP